MAITTATVCWVAEKISVALLLLVASNSCRWIYTQVVVDHIVSILLLCYNREGINHRLNSKVTAEKKGAQYRRRPNNNSDDITLVNILL